jgi:hypothetical protein
MKCIQDIEQRDPFFSPDTSRLLDNNLLHPWVEINFSTFTTLRVRIILRTACQRDQPNSLIDVTVGVQSPKQKGGDSEGSLNLTRLTRCQ